jgi:hypothetical protein
MPGSLDEEPFGHVGGLQVLVALTDGGDYSTIVAIAA